jgi:hypothetical protein
LAIFNFQLRIGFYHIAKLILQFAQKLGHIFAHYGIKPRLGPKLAFGDGFFFGESIKYSHFLKNPIAAKAKARGFDHAEAEAIAIR